MSEQPTISLKPPIGVRQPISEQTLVIIIRAQLTMEGARKCRAAGYQPMPFVDFVHGADPTDCVRAVYPKAGLGSADFRIVEKNP